MGNNETKQTGQLNASIQNISGTVDMGDLVAGSKYKATAGGTINITHINTLQQEDVHSEAARNETEQCLKAYSDHIAAIKQDPWAKFGHTLDQAFQQAIESLWATDFSITLTNRNESTEPNRNIFETYKRLLARTSRNGQGVRLVILADVGMGKTPALLSLRQHVAKNESQLIPIYIDLRNLHMGKMIESQIADQINATLINADTLHQPAITFNQIQAVLQQKTKNWNILLLLDDIDQLASNPNTYSLQSLRQFMKKYPLYDFVFTCRAANYRQPLGPLPTADLDDLTTEEVSAIFDKIPSGVLTNSQNLRDLAVNRALLKTILGLGRRMQDSGVTQISSLTRGTLIQKHNMGLLEKSIEKPSDQDLIRLELQNGLLEHLAFNKLVQGFPLFQESLLHDLITTYITEWHETGSWRQVLQELTRSGILNKKENRTYKFDDSSAEAYFAASAILQDPQKMDQLLENFTHPRWQPCLEILVGLMPDPTSLMFEMVDRDPFVAAHCLPFTGGAIDHELLEDAIIDSLLENLYLKNSDDRCQIVARIGHSTHSRAQKALEIALKREWSSRVILEVCRQIASRQSTTETFDTKAFEKQSSSTTDERITQVKMLLASSTSSTLPPKYLKKIILKRSYAPLVRGVAAFCLGFQRNKESREILLDLFQKNTKRDDFISWAIVDAIALKAGSFRTVADKQWLENPFSRRKPSNWEQLRSQAIYLVSFLPYDKFSKSLITRAMNDSSDYVKGYAYFAIGNMGILEMLPDLERCLASESEPFALRKAAEAVGKIGTIDSIPMLKQNLQNQRARTRWMVRKAIERIRYRNHID